MSPMQRILLDSCVRAASRGVSHMVDNPMIFLHLKDLVVNGVEAGDDREKVAAAMAVNFENFCKIFEGFADDENEKVRKEIFNVFKLGFSLMMAVINEQQKDALSRIEEDNA